MSTAPQATTPRLLRVRGPKDARDQYERHVANAIATALQRTTLAPLPLRAPARNPYAPARAASIAESVAVHSLTQAWGVRERYEVELDWARSFGTAAEEARAEAKLADLERVIRDYKEVIERAAPAARPGMSGLYLVTVPEVELDGPGALPAPELRRALDLWGLPGELRARVTAYLHGGTRAMPHRYRQDRERYVDNPKAEETERTLCADLLPHLFT
ncbi:hypothetical protein [Deinococcus sp. YIM 77859]|uniref:hypothetical protein n=1 Tax=Deinococcus sp. YIM 77859 TaxID=1540221 RepID=UPI000557C285|nr:hypothetical protein [Deinococcus sp. YIM 77859]